MSLFVEFHLIQNFAPSNLNRDDTGAPKDAVFGGYRRARVSSQCLKRTIRLGADFPSQNQGVRTKKLLELLRAQLREQYGRESEDVDVRIEAALAAAGLKLKDDGKTEYLLFLGQQEIDAFSKLVNEHWDVLATLVNGEKKSKKDAKASAPAEVVKQAKSIMNGGKALDVALFGRMLADMPEVNQDAACQVAHAISTHRVEREFDYFTAVDDMGGADETGAGMIGQVEFNSATFYRYSVVDPAKLAANLQHDKELALTGLHALTLATARAIPTGKQNTFAAHNPPSFIGVAIRHASPLNLANAFEKPVYARGGEALTAPSVAALADYDSNLAGIYGDANDAWAYIDLSGAWPAGKGEKLPSLNALADWVVRQARAKLEQ
ncbi:MULTISPECIES: type I-E CRISPR-associated protein Cas7/Cse4/CasC [Chromobacterium]|uniref:CRISPR-associated protein Cas7/Cse4/CasC, subtype I-E/ECOLI n=1 Tax=Chromobacterium violaceum TaxID=536 RepID=A0AAX2MAT4_CHRVL|nr:MULTISPECIES: type I-E CRISPR-associated protein Cas7/Cse4/CasC [Chromobacterium]MBX9349073.1 type I-E CRISPR-associated protein Cas7/Cse4/CasC [Chromobacterium vaccinii]MCD5327130.1 type I-E CRISPR-associated protein Cas7/Cse4/CasC [Chromobacterium piscinae]OLZ76150.1 type I-E CRISPR-associated protein Cas7/Cse4/CasC [Chromobacterium violaceum]OQS47548.1 type I-E CRISPR-associated protein Cas7/Cse4/CasC [Chromobacterium violaceum]OQS48439.1 type I-E CRISPR-associated protein Cas7/Cse4/CasC